MISRAFRICAGVTTALHVGVPLVFAIVIVAIMANVSAIQRLRTIASAPASPEHAAAATAFQLYILTHEAMRARLTMQNAAIYRRMARGLLKFVPAKQLPMPAEKFVRVLDALITGLLFTYFQTPELVTEDIIIAAFEALA